MRPVQTLEGRYDERRAVRVAWKEVRAPTSYKEQMPTRDASQPSMRADVPGEPARNERARRVLLLLFPEGASGLARFVPVLALLALLLFWAADQGGFPASLWYPGALIVLWLLVVCLADKSFSLGGKEWRTGALAFFALFTAWSFLSITWAGVKGDAWDGANQTLLYLTVYALSSRWAANVRVAAVFASLYAFVVAAIGFGTIESALHSGHVSSIFTAWRLAAPIGYQNGEAALFLIPLWPALYLASRREVPVLARGLLAATGGLLVQLAVLAQSRGSMYAFVIVFIIFLALVSGRGRALAAALVVLAVSALNLGRLLDVYTAGDKGASVASALSRARNGMVAVFLALLVLGTLIALLDRRLSLRERAARRLDLSFVSTFSVAVVLAVAITVGSVSRPLGRVEDAWHNFTTGASGGTSSSHFTSLYGTHRWDFWRVALDEFRSHPLLGVGADNFAVDYVRLRRSYEEPSDPHSMELKVMAQTGLVGSLLFLGFVAAGLVAVRRRGVDPFRKGLAASLVVGFAYWLVHGSVEWFWEIPALTGAALAFVGVAAAVSSSRPRAGAQSGRSDRRLLIVPVMLVAVAASVSYGAPWLSVRYVDRATSNWRSSPSQAYRMLDRARSIDPLSETPDLIAGTIAGREHDYKRMKVAYARALTRNSSDWYALLELGMAEYMTNERTVALDHLRHASTLNPREPVIRTVMRDVQARRRIDPSAIDRIFLRRAQAFAVGAH
jgi:O-antigen ligase